MSYSIPLNKISKNRIRYIIIYFFILSFAFDFKGNEGGTIIQYGMAVLNTVSFIVLAALFRFRLPTHGKSSKILAFWLLFIICGSFAAILNQVPINNFIRVIYPFCLFMLGFNVAFWFRRDQKGIELIVSALQWCAIISVMFTVYWGFRFYDVSLDTVRYQILSPVLPFLLIISGYDLLFTVRRKLQSIIFLIFSILLIGLSVTRGMFLVLLSLGLSIFIAYVLNLLKGYIKIPRQIVKVILLILLIVGIGLILEPFISPGLFERWIQRVGGKGYDVTFWLRVAAVVGQIEQLYENSFSWIFGKGFGKPYSFAPQFANKVFPYVRREYFYDAFWFPGEFMWANLLFYGGILGGFGAIKVIITGYLESIKQLSILLRNNAFSQPGTRYLGVALLSFIAFLGLTFTANPFGSRLASLFIGLLLSVFINQSKLLKIGTKQE